jgi:hypothetical protein
LNSNLFSQARIQGRGPAIVRPAIVSTAAFPSSGSYIGRQSRFDERSRRRYGDWSVLGVPAMLLWLDDNFAPDCDDSPYDDNY